MESRGIFLGKIDRKFGLLFFGVLTLILVNLSVIYLMQSAQKTDGAIIDASGRDRMLSQMIGFYADQIVDGDESAKQTLIEIIDLHHTSFYALKDGGIASGIADDKILPPTPLNIMPIVLEAETLWLDYKKNAEIISNEETFVNGELNPVVKISLDFLEINGPEMLNRNNEIVKAYVLMNGEKQKNFNYFLMVSLILSFLIIGFAFYSSRKITEPLKKLTEATEELEKGNFQARADIHTGDELQQLGEVFNRTTAALGRMDAEKKQLEKAKTEFLSITSHELRSPMTPMKAQLQMLLGGYFGKVTPKQKESLDIVLRNTSRLDKIIMDFLEVSRIEAARLKFRFVKTDLVSYIKRLVEEMKGFMPEKKVKVILKMEKLPIIEVDPDRVMQVLRNLINNAIKFCKLGCNIEVGVRIEKGMILFSVKDEGIGIKPEDQIRIFEPFFQAEQTMYREHRGTGLGLAIIRGIVESQNGKVWVESELGKGSTFYFTIPLKPVREAKPIKLLFSPKVDIEKQVKEIFKNILGPIWEKEFIDLKKQKGITFPSIKEYIDILVKEKIIEKVKAVDFRERISEVFEEKPKTITIKQLRERGFIKKS